MEINGTIYKLTNIHNGACYIGQTTATLKRRLNDHLRITGEKSPIKEATKKYGREGFSIQAIVSGIKSAELLDELERHYIRLFASNIKGKGYNVYTGGRKAGNSGMFLDKGISRFNEKIPTIHNAMLCLNLETGIYYESVKDAGRSLGLGNWSLYESIKRRKNYTDIVICDNYDHTTYKRKQKEIFKKPVIKKNLINLSEGKTWFKKGMVGTQTGVKRLFEWGKRRHVYCEQLGLCFVSASKAAEYIGIIGEANGSRVAAVCNEARGHVRGYKFNWIENGK